MSSLTDESKVTVAQISKNPIVIGAVALAVMIGYVLPEITKGNEATLADYMMVEKIAESTTCETTRAKIREALSDGRITSAEIASISGNSTSAACDRDELMSRIALSLN